MKMKRLTAALLVLVCLTVGMGVWAITGEMRISKLNARILELETAAMNAPEPAAESAVASLADPDAIAAEFNGGVVTAAEAAEEYALLSGYYQLMGMDEAEYAENAKYSVIDGLVEEKVLALKAQEAGVYELSDAQKAEIEERVKLEYEDNIQYYMAFRFDESKTDEQVREETIAYLNENGYSYEQMLANARQNAWRDLLYEHVTRDMTIDDAQLREFYDSQVTTAEMTYLADFTEYEMDSDGSRTIVWHPSGVRRIQAIQIGFGEEQSVEYLSLQAAIESGDTSRQAELDALYQTLEPKAQEALTRAQAGEDFAALAAEYGELRELGVSSQSTLCGEAFRDAALALANVGDISSPVRTDGGICILRYAADVPAGQVPYEDVKEDLRVNYEAEIKSSMYNAAVLQWMEEANIQYHLDTF